MGVIACWLDDRFIGIVVVVAVVVVVVAVTIYADSIESGCGCV